MDLRDAANLASRTWDAFCAGSTTAELWGEGDGHPQNWIELMSTKEATIALGAVLLWLRTNSAEVKKRDIEKVMQTIPSEFKDTATWLTRGVASERPTSIYDEQTWQRALRSPESFTAIARVCLADTAPHEKRDFHSGVLKLFDEGSAGDRDTIVDSVLRCLKSDDTDLNRWASELLTYTELFKTAIRKDPMIAYEITPGARQLIRVQQAGDHAADLLAARGYAPQGLDRNKLRLVDAAPTESARQWPQPTNYLDADTLRFDHGDGPINLFEITRSLGIPVYQYPDLDVSWWGMVMWDPAFGRPAIVLRQPQHPSRERFTLAHEIGHLWLRSLGHLGSGEDDERMLSPRNAERLVNRFASRLLIPAQILTQQPMWSLHDLEHLAQTYDISLQATAIAVVEANQRYAVVMLSDSVVDWLWVGQQFPIVNVERGDVVPANMRSQRTSRWELSRFWLRDPSDASVDVQLRRYEDGRTLLWLSFS